MRGNTTRQIVQMLRDAGAREVHLRISAPPIRNPCHYGIDMSTREEMIAHDRTVEEIAAELGCDSLAYLSLEGVYEAIERERATHCDACFSGEYPLADTEASAQAKDAFEHALPLAPATVRAVCAPFGPDRCRGMRRRAMPPHADASRPRSATRRRRRARDRPDGALREHFGFDALPARAGGGGATRRWPGATCSW